MGSTQMGSLSHARPRRNSMGAGARTARRIFSSPAFGTHGLRALAAAGISATTSSRAQLIRAPSARSTRRCQQYRRPLRELLPFIHDSDSDRVSTRLSNDRGLLYGSEFPLAPPCSSSSSSIQINHSIHTGIFFKLCLTGQVPFLANIKYDNTTGWGQGACSCIPPQKCD